MGAMVGLKVGKKEENGPTNFIVQTSRGDDSEIIDVWADEVEIVNGRLVFYRERDGLLGKRMVVAAFGDWDHFLADAPDSDYGGIDPRLNL